MVRFGHLKVAEGGLKFGWRELKTTGKEHLGSGASPDVTGQLLVCAWADSGTGYALHRLR